jgi:hypothetical protein
VASWRLLSKKMRPGFERDRMKKYLDRRARTLIRELPQ